MTDPQAAAARAQVRGRRVDVRGVGIWAELHGPPDAVPVVLVHRMAAQGFEWPDELVGALIDAGYCVVTYDHRGFGRSESGPLDEPLAFQDLVDDAAGVLASFGVTSALGSVQRMVSTSMSPSGTRRDCATHATSATR